MAIPTLHGLNKSENGPHVISCRDNADPLEKNKFLQLFLGTGNSLFAALSWIPHIQTYQAVLTPSIPPVLKELTPNVLYNVLKHLQHAPSDSPCYGHTFYLDTSAARLVFCPKNQVPKNTNTVDLMARSMGINGYYLSDTIDGSTGDPEGRVRIKTLIKKTLDTIAAAKLKSSTPQQNSNAPGTPVVRASQGTQLPGAFQRVMAPAAPTRPSSGPFGTVAPTGRGNVGGPYGARSDFRLMGCDP